MLPQQFHCFLHFFRTGSAGTAQQNRIGLFHLILEKLTEIFQIHFALVYIYHSHLAGNLNIFSNTFHSLYYFRQFANTRWLNNNPVWCIGCQHFLQRCFKITYQRAADASRIHLPDFHTAFLQKSAVDTDFAKFIFNQHHFTAGQRLF